VVSCANSLEIFLKNKLGEIWQLVFWKEKKEKNIFFWVKFLNHDSVSPFEKNKKKQKKVLN
jgi:hypothetical protein